MARPQQEKLIIYFIGTIAVVFVAVGAVFLLKILELDANQKIIIDEVQKATLRIESLNDTNIIVKENNEMLANLTKFFQRILITSNYTYP